MFGFCNDFGHTFGFEVQRKSMPEVGFATIGKGYSYEIGFYGIVVDFHFFGQRRNTFDFL